MTCTCAEQKVCDYTNYETFHVAMFLSNNRPVYDGAMRLARTALTHFPDVEDRNTLSGCMWIDLADHLEQFVEQAHLLINARELRLRTDSDRLAHALLTAALGRVNWRELAEEWLEHARE